MDAIEQDLVSIGVNPLTLVKGVSPSSQHNTGGIMEHSFKSLVWFIASCFLWATSDVLSAASDVTRGTVFHATGVLSRLYLLLGLFALAVSARALYRAWQAGEFGNSSADAAPSLATDRTRDIW